MMMTKAKKQPAFMFYPGDWLKDPSLTMCSPATRGIWIDLLSAMHENGRTGEITGRIDQLSRIARCIPEEMAKALDELAGTESAEIKNGNGKITEDNGKITVISRRMRREYKEREGNNLRQKKHKKNAGVTQKKRKSNNTLSVSVSVSEKEKEKKERNFSDEIQPLPALSTVDAQAVEMSRDFQQLVEHWKTLGQIVDLRSREGMRELMQLGRPIAEVKAVMSEFVKARKKAGESDWRKNCTLSGMAKGHYADFLPSKNKPKIPKAATVEFYCDDCNLSFFAMRGAAISCQKCGKRDLPIKSGLG